MSMIIFFVILYDYQSCNHNKHNTFFLKMYKNRREKKKKKNNGSNITSDSRDEDY